jgi:peptidoglycan/LPS O-acetylase OafA/YrhL
MTHSSRRIAVIDLARTLSILAVMALHFGNDDSKNGTPSPLLTFLSSALTAFGKNGRYGVTIFFVISGFVISRMIAMRYGDLYAVDLKDFYIRRIARIWPLLVTTVAVGLYLMSVMSDAHMQLASPTYQVLSPSPQLFDPWFFLALFTMTLNWLFIARSGQYGLHWAILWSIAIEEQFYLLFPIILRRLGSNEKMVKLLILLVCIGPVARWIGWNVCGSRAALENSFAAYDLLSMGVLLFIAQQKYNDVLRLAKWLSPCLCAAGVLLGTLTYFATDSANQWHTIFGPSLMGFSVVLFLLGGLVMPSFNKIPQFIIFPGQLSYGMYLYHPLCMLRSAYLFGSATGPELFGLFVLVTIAVSAASFYMFEQPLSRIVRMKFSR